MNKNVRLADDSDSEEDTTPQKPPVKPPVKALQVKKKESSSESSSESESEPEAKIKFKVPPNQQRLSPRRPNPPLTTRTAARMKKKRNRSRQPPRNLR